MRKRGITLCSLLLVGLSLVLTACGSGGKKIVIGTQNYTEPKIIAEMYKALIEDRTGLTVEIKPDLASSKVVIEGMRNNELHMATLYTGEVFNGYFEVEQTKDREKVLQQAQQGFSEHYQLKWFDPYGFENTYAFTVRKEVAQKYNLQNVSDLKPYADTMRIGVDNTWLERESDGYRAFQKTYGFQFKEAFPMQIGLVYEAVANEEVDVVLAYTTDAGLKQYDLQTLRDDKQFFPPFDASPVVREETLKEYPELEEIVSLLIGKIDADTMTELNYYVDVEHRSEKEVAVEFLRQLGLLE